MGKITHPRGARYIRVTVIKPAEVGDGMIVQMREGRQAH